MFNLLRPSAAETSSTQRTSMAMGAAPSAWWGKLINGRRDPFVIATKYSLTTRPPAIPTQAAITARTWFGRWEDSLKRLRTDYIEPALSACLGSPHAGRGDPARLR